MSLIISVCKFPHRFCQFKRDLNPLNYQRIVRIGVFSDLVGFLSRPLQQISGGSQWNVATKYMHDDYFLKKTFMHTNPG
jgi:hypothetical protein